MIPYLLLLLFISILNYKRSSNLIDAATLITLVCFAGFRASSVGTDTGNYVRMFQYIDLLDVENTRIEFLFIFLMKFAHLASDNYASILTLISLICVFFSLRVIKYFSINNGLSIFIYLTLGSYIFLFNGARQAIATAIFGLAFKYIKQKNIFKFIFVIFVASLFHKTVLLMLPVYFILDKNLSFIKLISVTTFFSILLVFMSQILSLTSDGFSNQYSVYVGRGSTGGGLLTIYFVILTVILMWLKAHISSSNINRYNFFLNISIFHTIIYIVVQLTGVDVNLIRLSTYFGLGFVLIFPIVFKEIKLLNQPLPKALFFGVNILFFYVYLSKMSSLIPYKLNTTLF